MNQNLSKLGAQLREIWKQLGNAQRFSVISATFVLFAGLGALALWSSHGEYGLLYGRLSDSEAAKVIAALDDAKVAYKVGSGGSSILVPSEKVHAMRMQLAGKGIPRGDGVGFEIFDKPNFGISDFVQRANYLRAVQGELSRTIAQVDQIESARVMVVMPENRLSVDINFDTVTRTEEKFDPDGQVVRNSTVNDDQVDSQTFRDASGVPGVQTNTGGTDTNNVAAVPVTTSKTRKKVAENKYEINKT